METHLTQSLQPGEAIASSTLPKTNQKNVKLAGQRHPETGIVFNERGFPVFDDVAVFDTIIPREIAMLKTKNRDVLHKIEATKTLSLSLKRGEISTELFNHKQLNAIHNNSHIIPGLTWHHHETTGRMQLIDFEFHQKTGHVGGMGVWLK